MHKDMHDEGIEAELVRFDDATIAELGLKHNWTIVPTLKTLKKISAIEIPQETKDTIFDIIHEEIDKQTPIERIQEIIYNKTKIKLTLESLERYISEFTIPEKYTISEKARKLHDEVCNIITTVAEEIKNDVYYHIILIKYKGNDMPEIIAEELLLILKHMPENVFQMLYNIYLPKEIHSINIIYNFIEEEFAKIFEKLKSYDYHIERFFESMESSIIETNQTDPEFSKIKRVITDTYKQIIASQLNKVKKIHGEEKFKEFKERAKKAIHEYARYLTITCKRKIYEMLGLIKLE